MKIAFERTGGFTGLRLVLDLDLASLSVEEATSLQEQVDAVGFFDEREINQQQVPADGFQYHITVERDGFVRSIQVQDGSLTEPLQMLVNDLTLRARLQRRTG